jgi:hypothetical protein
MGSWTEITSIEVPQKAAEGQAVNVRVTVKNIYSQSLWVVVTGYVDGSEFPQPLAEIPGGGSYTFDFYFYMPARDISLQFWSYIWLVYPEQPGYWQVDDYRTASAPLEVTVAFSEFKITDYIKV